MNPAICPPDVWGACLTFGHHKEIAHITSSIYGAPEGAVIVTCCALCGGRDEVLLRFPEDGGPPSKQAVDEILNWQADLWARDHAQCAVVPMGHSFPQEALEMAEAFEGRLRQNLAEGKDTPGMAALLTAEGKSAFFDLTIGAAVNPSGRPSQVIAGQHWAVRQRVAELGLDPVAVVACGEAWQNPHPAPGPTPDAAEIGLVVITTPTAGRVGTAPILRHGGVADEGPGELGGLTWKPLVEPQVLVDGLLALPHLSSGSAN